MGCMVNAPELHRVVHTWYEHVLLEHGGMHSGVHPSTWSCITNRLLAVNVQHAWRLN